jgi:hypothetical protein
MVVPWRLLVHCGRESLVVETLFLTDGVRLWVLCISSSLFCEPSLASSFAGLFLWTPELRITLLLIVVDVPPSPTVCRLLVYFCCCFSVWKSITQRELIPFTSLRPKLWTKYTTGRGLFYLLSRDQLQVGRCMQLSDCSIPVARECVVVWTFVRFLQTD